MQIALYAAANHVTDLSEVLKGHIPELLLVDIDPFCLFLVLDVR